MAGEAMTDPCPGHRWSPLLPVWVFNAAGELVKHPTFMQRVCLMCEHYETFQVREGEKL